MRFVHSLALLFVLAGCRSEDETPPKDAGAEAECNPFYNYGACSHEGLLCGEEGAGSDCDFIMDRCENGQWTTTTEFRPACCATRTCCGGGSSFIPAYCSALDASVCPSPAYIYETKCSVEGLVCGLESSCDAGPCTCRDGGWDCLPCQSARDDAGAARDAQGDASDSD